MDWSQIVTLVSSIALPIFTAGLVWATIALCRSTSRYADATREMAHSTEISSRIAARQNAAQIIQTLLKAIQDAPAEIREEIEHDYPHFQDNLRRFASRCSDNIDRLFEDAFDFDIRAEA